MRRIPVTLTAWLLAAAAGADGIRLPPIDHAATREECGSCHLAFPPQMLPARSWDRIMHSLGDHFGEDASLGEAARADIAAYLRANAADSPGAVGGQRFSPSKLCSIWQKDSRLFDSTRITANHFVAIETSF